MGKTDDYPADWPEIALVLKHKVGWRCEHCDHSHDVASGHVLTVHHLDGIKSNCASENLVALCQKCHLSIQGKMMPGQLVMDGFRMAWMVKRGVGIVSGAR